ncbi:MAG: DNA-protecting protein DprA [Flavobacteriales bacterium]|nr:DNA-protecting protein DprA [Flavobacteriales bacterium]
MEESYYQIALNKLEGVGSARARALVSHCGGVRQIFDTSKKDLAAIPGLSMRLVNRLNREEALRRAEDEMRVIQRDGIDVYFYLNDDYPSRLKHCEDGPVLLYGAGNMRLNPPRIVSIVGTRSCTAYGERMTERLVDGLEGYGALVVSGLAYGIDTLAHRASVARGMQTVGVLGHSLDRVYPAQNESLVAQMKQNGGVLSEFEFGTKPDRENFPQRNRIVAGMSDVTIVIETMVKGGSMITARMAAGYSRDVAAFPGATDAPYSSGCNHLIKTNIAALVEGIDDLAYLMGWEKDKKPSSMQKQLFVELTDVERQVFSVLEQRQRASIDNLSLDAGLPMSKTAAALLELEFKGVVRSLPGKVYEVA